MVRDIIAQRFSAGKSGKTEQVPEGRHELSRPKNSKSHSCDPMRNLFQKFVGHDTSEPCPAFVIKLRNIEFRGSLFQEQDAES
jgi:hypothetical protein